MAHLQPQQQQQQHPFRHGPMFAGAAPGPSMQPLHAFIQAMNPLPPQQSGPLASYGGPPVNGAGMLSFLPPPRQDMSTRPPQHQAGFLQADPRQQQQLQQQNMMSPVMARPLWPQQQSSGSAMPFAAAMSPARPQQQQQQQQQHFEQQQQRRRPDMHPASQWSTWEAAPASTSSPERPPLSAFEGLHTQGWTAGDQFGLVGAMSDRQEHRHQHPFTGPPLVGGDAALPGIVAAGQTDADAIAGRVGGDARVGHSLLPQVADWRLTSEQHPREAFAATSRDSASAYLLDGKVGGGSWGSAVSEIGDGFEDSMLFSYSGGDKATDGQTVPDVRVA